MIIDPVSRRHALLAGAAACGAAALGSRTFAAEGADPSERSPSSESPFRFCLNTSTISGQKLSLADEVEIAAKAGYDAIEPWIREIEAYQQGGGSLADLRKRIADAGLKVESAIGFSPWIIDDDEKRAAGLEQAKREMDLVRQIGGDRIAAPPAGATRDVTISLPDAAKRYRALIEAGESIGVVPQVEVWGFSKNLSRLGETAFVAIEAGHPKACILPDIYHVYKGGSDFAGLGLLSGQAVHVFHVNDYPADPPREMINDAHRVYPGDGVAPVSEILRRMHAAGFRGVLSLELFNRDYWQQDALKVAQTGLEKMRAAAAMALG